MRHFGEIGHENLVGNGLSEGHRQLHFRVAVDVAVENRTHRHNLRIFVGDFDADGAFGRNRRDDADAFGCKLELEVVAEAADRARAHTFCRNDFIEGYGRTDSCLDLGDFHSEAAQCLCQAAFVEFHLLNVDAWAFVLCRTQQIDCRKAEMR